MTGYGNGECVKHISEDVMVSGGLTMVLLRVGTIQQKNVLKELKKND